jgi:hypothetical protein
MNSKLVSFVQLLSVIVIVVGFRFITQAGQGVGVVQNDGYAGSGGALILLGGVTYGYLSGRSTTQKKK